jgi:type IV secretory pathway VirB10-like protein
MFSKPLAFVLLALGCVTAAAGGAYVASRHNASDAAVAAPAPISAPSASTATPNPAPTQPVAETEAPVTAANQPAALPEPVVEKKPAAASVAKVAERAPSKPASSPRPSASAPRTAHDGTASNRTVPSTASSNPEPQAVAPPPAPAQPEAPKPVEPQPEAPRVPQFEEVIVPASAVIGLQIESSISTERARVEDRVDARVTRDVIAGGRVAIPAGSRVLGSVTLVERGGKVKERARLGVRFHTLVLGDGSEVPLKTDEVYRDGESPAGGSAKKIGGAAVGGAILGAILGGGKGAAIGGATGAAGGTAAVMAGDRNAATLNRGEVVTAKLSTPATITVERRE